MQITQRRAGDVVILDLKGNLVRGVGDEMLREAVDRLLADRSGKLLINLSDVTFLDSSGIGELVSGFTTVANQGGVVKLLNLTKRVQDLLQITKLYTVFEVFDDEAKAVQSYK